ncbi:hypothetical protein QML11_28240, partial [Klebsiella pneumoniae]|uniref:hypothetical protein n=1 Tax=Klebsiella pneumoniae TaxID=573 RepID=UPI003A84DBDB
RACGRGGPAAAGRPCPVPRRCRWRCLPHHHENRCCVSGSGPGGEGGRPAAFAATSSRVRSRKGRTASAAQGCSAGKP